MITFPLTLTLSPTGGEGKMRFAGQPGGVPLQGPAEGGYSTVSADSQTEIGNLFLQAMLGLAEVWVQPSNNAIIKVPKQSLGENLSVPKQELGNEIKMSHRRPRWHKNHAASVSSLGLHRLEACATRTLQTNEMVRKTHPTKAKFVRSQAGTGE